MSYLFKTNKSLIAYSLICLIIFPIFGFNFFFSLLSNLLILIILVPLLLLIVGFIGFNSLKSRIQTCGQCGSISLSLNQNCVNCGADLNNKNYDVNEINKPGERTIEVRAEEIE